MTNPGKSIPQSRRHPRREATTDRRSALALAVSSAIAMGDPAFAANDKVVEDLQAEVARLKEALKKKDEELAAQKSATPIPQGEEIPVSAPPGSELPVSEPPGTPATAEAPPEEPKALGEVVVRTNRGLKKEHDVPKSVSVITGEQLQETGAYNLADFSKRSANLSRDTGNPRTLALSIRGVGRKGITEAQDPSVLTGVDGISFAYNSLATWDQVDVESIEVNRGPGGTYGGKNYSLGSVNITTKAPSFTSGGRYAMRYGINDTFYGDASYGGPLIDDLLAWRGTFFVHKQAGVYQNDYDLGRRTYIDTNQISGRTQFLLTPSDNFTARLRVDVEPKTQQNFNGLNFFHPLPATYTDGNGWNATATADNRLQRGYFKQLPGYGTTSYYNYYNGTQNNDNQQPLQTGMHGVTGDMNWNLGSHTITSITGWKDFDFDARNDEGTPYDVTLQNGGGVRYEQFSQELRLASEKGGLLDYVTGLYYIKTQTEVDAKNGWGSDAGYWFAGGNPQLYDDPAGTQVHSGPITGRVYTKYVYDPLANGKSLEYAGVYGRLTATPGGRYLLGDALNGLRTTGQQQIKNESPAVYGTANWHVTNDLTVTTGLRATYEDRTTTGWKQITNNGYGGILNPSVSTFGVKLGGFDSINVSAASAGGYNAIGPDGRWHTYNYDKNFNPKVDFNTYVVNNKIVSKEKWVKAGKPNDATSYATNDGFYTNGQKKGLGTDVSNASKVEGESNIIRVVSGANGTAITTDKAHYDQALKAANRAAKKYFGTDKTWDTLTPAQKRQIADAQNLRKAQIGTVYNTVTAEPFRKVQLTSLLSPQFKINEEMTAYGTWQHGEKAGIAQIVNGLSMQAKPEVTESFEIGLKSFFFDNALTINTDVFYMDISDYQQAIQVVDQYTTDLNNDGTLYYTTATLNAKKVKAWGVEVDGVYTGLPHTSLRFAAAYNDAWYADFKNSPLAPEQDPTSPQYKNNPYQDLSGKRLPGASLFSFNVGGEYRYPVFDGYDAHTSLNYAFQTGYNADVTLSKYGWVNGYGLLDAAIGLGRKDRTIDISFLVRNLLDTQPLAQGSQTGTLQTAPRWYGVVLSGQF